MAFDTKPNLSNDKFEQFSGETLTLNGITEIHGILEAENNGVIQINSGGTLLVNEGGVVSGITVSAAGSDTSIQFNNNGSFSGSTGITWNQGVRQLNVVGDIAISGTSFLRAGNNDISAIELGSGSVAAAAYGIVIGDNSTVCGSGLVIGTSSSGTTGIVIGDGSCGSDNGGNGTIIIGDNSKACGSNHRYTVVIGNNAIAHQSGSIAIGNSTQAGCGVAVGFSADANGINGLALGNASYAGSTSSVGIGTNAKAYTAGDIAVGSGAISDSIVTGGIAIGSSTRACAGRYPIAIGHSSCACGNRAIAIGRVSVSQGTCPIAIGYCANALGTSAIGIGSCSNAFANQSIGLGHYTVATGTSAIAIGQAAKAVDISSIAIGTNAYTSACRSFMLGIGDSGSEKIENDIINSVAFGWGNQSITNAKGNLYPVSHTTGGQTTTTDNSLTTLMSIALDDNHVYSMDLSVVGAETGGTNRAYYKRTALFYREGGTATLQGTVDATYDNETNGNWNATLAAVSNSVQVQVQGDTGETVYWNAVVRLSKMKTSI